MQANADPAGRRPRRRRLALIAGVFALLLLLLMVSLRIALRPENLTPLLLRHAGVALGLDITSQGPASYRLRGTPQLVVRGVVAREPGATRPVLRAQRVLISVPWATLRSRGAVLDVQRVELDAPVLDLTAFQGWRTGRPPAAAKMPTFTRGISIRRGRIDGEGWRVDGIALDLPRLHPDEPVRAHVAGRYLAAPIQVGLDLHIALTRPANGVGAAAVGGIAVRGDDWTFPARIRLSGPLRLGSTPGLGPARLAISARYGSGATQLPFVLGLHGPARLEGSTLTLAPVGLALRGQGALPSFDAGGAIAVGRRLVLRLEGALPGWNGAWPALPPPLGQSASPLPFRLEYTGKPDASDIATLRLQRDDTRFNGRFRLLQVVQWARNGSAGSPLPPLDGRVVTPRMTVSGAQLEGIEVEIDDPGVESAP